MLVAFTKDQDILDENLVDNLHYLGIYGLIMLSTVILVSVTIPMFSVFAGILIAVTLVMLFFYLPAATTLKQQKVETAGDLIGLVAETLEGLPIITAFGQNKYFIATAANKIDEHHRALFNGESLNLWLAFYCDLYGAILVLAVCIFAVLMRTQLGAAAVGLAFSNTIQMLVFYTWTVRNVADAISLMSSTEKVGWLATKTPQEGDALYTADHGSNASGGKDAEGGKMVVSVDAGSDGGAPAGWPRQGTIEFQNVWMKYLPSAPYALKGVTFRLNHSEKAGVVGRTGSGKSTLLLALYRMFELDKGTIRVDGVDIASLALRKLRPSLSIIPQEPVVWSGTVRTNLDPFNEFPDTDLWEVIKKAGLEQQVKSAGGIDGKIDGTGGQAWSLGQQQLVCLCRAALRKVPVLCLDEATAAMDPHTEQEVQAVIKRVFADRTTLTIAHRLDTVIESDQVLVMEAGVLKEMAPPSVLLDNRESMFSKLVDKSGAQAAAALRQMAAEYYASKR
jgi:ABC-type multidrug transport system fused ATPase/permease subunit